MDDKVVEEIGKANKECLSKMTEEQKDKILVSLIPHLAVGAKVVSSMLIKCHDNNKVPDEDMMKETALFTAGLAASAIEICGISDDGATGMFTILFSMAKMAKDGKQSLDDLADKLRKESKNAD